MPNSRSMSCFLAHQTAGLCPNSSPNGMKFSSPSQLIFLLSFTSMLLIESYLYLHIKFLTLNKSWSRFVYWIARWGSWMWGSQSLRLGWCSWNYLSCYYISFCRKSFKFVSSSGRARPNARRYPLEYALISVNGFWSNLLPMLPADLWTCFHRS